VYLTVSDTLIIMVGMVAGATALVIMGLATGILDDVHRYADLLALVVALSGECVFEFITITTLICTLLRAGCH